MPSWPGSLPTKPLSEGYEESYQDVTIRTTMDGPVAKVRRRFTSPVIPFSGSFLLDKTDLATLLSFFSGDAGYGAVAFTWALPRTGASIETRFVGPPVWRAVGNENYQIDCRFEALP